MKKQGNGISPVIAVILTVLVLLFAVWMFKTGHNFWGVVFALITLDFGADAVLSFRNA